MRASLPPSLPMYLAALIKFEQSPKRHLHPSVQSFDIMQVAMPLGARIMLRRRRVVQQGHAHYGSQIKGPQIPSLLASEVSSIRKQSRAQRHPLYHVKSHHLSAVLPIAPNQMSVCAHVSTAAILHTFVCSVSQSCALRNISLYLHSGCFPSFRCHGSVWIRAVLQ